jgi:hypothetical protein
LRTLFELELSHRVTTFNHRLRDDRLGRVDLRVYRVVEIDLEVLTSVSLSLECLNLARLRRPASTTDS